MDYILSLSLFSVYIQMIGFESNKSSVDKDLVKQGWKVLEKVSDDIYLKQSLININTRKSHYGINPNYYMKLYSYSPIKKQRKKRKNRF